MLLCILYNAIFDLTAILAAELPPFSLVDNSDATFLIVKLILMHFCFKGRSKFCVVIYLKLLLMNCCVLEIMLCCLYPQISNTDFEPLTL